jgi:hypothetical protein
MKTITSISLALASLAIPTLAHASEVTLNPSQDATLCETSDGSTGLGKGDLWAGKNNMLSNTLRRALIQFDVSGIPSTATITSVQVKLYLVRTGDSTSHTYSLHPVSDSWGEGNSGTTMTNGCVSAVSNDSTWLHRFYSGTTWTSSGGDFGAASQTASIGTTLNQYYTFSSNSSLVADVQGWVSGSTTNNGWILIGDESTAQTARRFNSREEASNQPELIVDYTP